MKATISLFVVLLAAGPAFAVPAVTGEYVCLEREQQAAHVTTIAVDPNGRVELKFVNNQSRPGVTILKCEKPLGECDAGKITTKYEDSGGWDMSIRKVSGTKVEIVSTTVQNGKPLVLAKFSCVKSGLF